MATVPAAPSRPWGRRADGTRVNTRRHEEAVVQAEARRLALALAPFRVLRKPALERAAGAYHWHEGSFERALEVAVRAGMIDRLPAGFYRAGRRSRALRPAPAAGNGPH